MTHREKFTAERLKFKPKPEKKWNHQDELSLLVGKKLRLSLPHGAVIGTLIAADQFSLKLELVSTDGEYKSVVTYFKHSIISFQLSAS